MGIVSTLLFQSCSDFLDKQPIDAFNDDNYWTSESSVKTYAWKLYDEFLGYGNAAGTTAEFYFQGATPCMNISDDLNNNSFVNYSATSSTTNADWNSYYTAIRHANLMLERLPRVNMQDVKAKHWDGVARFFRAYTYFRLVQRFGDVPYYNKYMNWGDAKAIYVKRTPRNAVMDSVKKDLELAASEMLENESPNGINKYCALALLSRVGLYEGTYRKYHNIGDGAEFLKVSQWAAEQLMASSKFIIGSDFKAVYNSIDLSANKEVILYKKYLPSILCHSVQCYTNTSTIINGMTRSAVESYVCADGLPISQSPLYKGDLVISDVVANRDKRLLATIDVSGISYKKYAGLDKKGKDSSVVVTVGGLTSSTGYIINLFNNPSLSGSEVTTGGKNHTDAPIFTYAEVLLNFAEAKAEQGSLTQSDLDNSINILRRRAGIAPLTLNGTDVAVNGINISDPNRTAALEQIGGVVSPIVWEIRRDRRAELMTWTYIRYYDIMRWHKGEYLDFSKNPNAALGARTPLRPTNGSADKDYKNAMPDGYVDTYGAFTYNTTAKRVFDPMKHYLNSIPINDILLFSAEGVELTQNPGWNK